MKIVVTRICSVIVKNLKTMNQFLPYKNQLNRSVNLQTQELVPSLISHIGKSKFC